MLRSALMVGVVAFSCLGIAQSAEAREGFSHGSFDGRGFARFASPRFERRADFFQNHRFFADRRFFDRDRFFFDRNRFFGFGPFGDFGFGDFGGFPYYPYYTGYDPGYYPNASAAPPAGASADAPLLPMRAADLPPCSETTDSGVVITRGQGCAHNRS